MNQALTPQLVRAACRLLLGREPENEVVVRQALNYGSVEALRAAFFGSSEFLSLGLVKPRLVPIGAAPISVQWAADPATTARLLAHVANTWTRLGEERPHWSVLSAEDFTPERIGSNEAAFFASGAGDCRDLIAILARHGLAPGDLPRLFEFGCGLGRVTAHLSRAFHDIAACDVSASHMALARRVLAEAGSTNVTFHLARTIDFGMTAPFDLWFSRIVLQHNPPPVIAMILRRALNLLAPGGLAVFQVPTYAVGYSFNVADYLAGLTGAGRIEMHVLPQPVVFAMAREAECDTLEALEDISAGPAASWNSTVFVLRKTRQAMRGRTKPI